jgi:hypothetical protein
MKAYNTDSRHHACSTSQNVVTLFRKRCTGELSPLRPAPPRQLLEVFGGTMSIEDFRAASTGPINYVPIPPKMIMRETAIAEQMASATRNAAIAKAQASHDLHAKVDFADIDIKNESLRLKRPKKTVSGKTVLTSSAVIPKPPVFVGAVLPQSASDNGLARTMLGETAMF